MAILAISIAASVPEFRVARTTVLVSQIAWTAITGQVVMSPASLMSVNHAIDFLDNASNASQDCGHRIAARLAAPRAFSQVTVTDTAIKTQAFVK